MLPTNPTAPYSVPRESGFATLPKMIRLSMNMF